VGATGDFRHNRPNGAVILPFLKRARRDYQKEAYVDFVMFEDVDGMEVFVNPERVIWVREYPGQTTVISCGDEDKFAVRLSPAQTVAALGKLVR
jgi:hypothetical protein